MDKTDSSAVDRELLEQAAKAAGIEARYENGVLWYRTQIGDLTAFNPLKDDGAALRLAVKVKMCVDHGYESAFANVTSVSDDENVEALHAEADVPYDMCGGDMFAATRLAIVLCAADIGRCS